MIFEDDECDSIDWTAKPTQVKTTKNKTPKEEEEFQEEEELSPLSMSQFAANFLKWYVSQSESTEEKDQEKVEEVVNDDKPSKSADDVSLDELKELFSRLPTDNGDPEVLSTIYEAVTLADQLLKRLEQTSYVLSIEKELFGQALSCLVASSQAHFLASPHFTESLSTLAIFLYYRLTPPADPPAPVTTSRSDSPNSSFGDDRQNTNIPTCIYCKEPGHTKANCSKLKKLICFRCFETGHCGKWCTNDPLVDMGNSARNRF